MSEKITFSLDPDHFASLLESIERQRGLLAGQVKAARIAIAEGMDVTGNLSRIDDCLFELDTTEEVWAELMAFAPKGQKRNLPEIDIQGVMDAEAETEQFTKKLFAVAEHFFGVVLEKTSPANGTGKKHRAEAVRPVLERLHRQVREIIDLNAATGIPVTRLENQGIRSAVEQSLEKIVRQDFEQDWKIASSFYETHRIQDLPWETFVGNPQIH